MGMTIEQPGRGKGQQGRKTFRHAVETIEKQIEEAEADLDQIDRSRSNHQTRLETLREILFAVRSGQQSSDDLEDDSSDAEEE